MTADAPPLEEPLGVLERTPEVLNALLRGTPPAWHDADEGPGSWSPRQVVAHLVHAEETNWIPRASVILQQGEAARFPPFDRFGHLERYAGWGLDVLLDRFAEVRGRSLETFRAWEPDDVMFGRRGRHPELGVVTLRQLLATWVVHDLGHIRQIVRVMARCYAAEVGPWRAYLSILSR